MFSFSSFLLVLVENKLPVHFNWTNNLFELFPRYLKYHTYSCISRPPFLSTKIRFFIISGSIQTDRNFPKVNLLFLGMCWKHGELKNCRAQCNRVEVYQLLFKLPRLKRTSTSIYWRSTLSYFVNHIENEISLHLPNLYFNAEFESR